MKARIVVLHIEVLTDMKINQLKKIVKLDIDSLKNSQVKQIIANVIKKTK